MQVSPNVEFWLRVWAIIVPALSATVVALVTYLFGRRMANRQKELNKELSLFQSGLQQSLNKELENHKGDISRELENHRFQLQSAFQTRLYEFQTRYSWLHQQRAEAIVKLYELVARVYMDLLRWSAPGTGHLTKPADEFYYDAVDHLTEMSDFFDQKRIFFDDREIAGSVITMIHNSKLLYCQHPDIEHAKDFSGELADSKKEEADKMIRKHITPVLVQLRSEFRKLLEAETPIPVVERPAIGPDSKDRRNT